jgi:RimJ/RimL family protein N-acetyltransferase
MIKLRRIEEEDLELLRNWRNDSKIYSWCRQNNLISKEDQAAWFERQTEDRMMRMFAIDAKIPCQDFGYTDETVGVCGLTDIDLINSRAEFSLYIAPDFQKRGYARETLGELFKYGFETLGLHGIWGETFEGNPALHLFKSVGMEITGFHKDFYFKNGKYLNANIISITEEQWKNLNSIKS